MDCPGCGIAAPLLWLMTIGFACLAVASPLAVYTLTLAAFGLPHVLSELRYVDRRFCGKLRSGLLARFGILLLAIVGVRTASVFHLAPSSFTLPAELGLVALLALSVAGNTARQKISATAIALTIGLATAFDPFSTAVGFSILHNLTPLGFLWQITPPPQRPSILSWATVALVIGPLLIACGAPRILPAGLGYPDFPLDPLGAGPLSNHLFVYVLPSFINSDHAVDLFTASVMAQGGHYFSVIVLLPRLLKTVDPKAAGIVPWPTERWFWLTAATVTVMGLPSFAQGFSHARSLYGIVASAHAWIEIPLLILALCGPHHPNKMIPNVAEDKLARAETSNDRRSVNAAIQAISPASTSTTITSSPTTLDQ